MYKSEKNILSLPVDSLPRFWSPRTLKRCWCSHRLEGEVEVEVGGGVSDSLGVTGEGGDHNSGSSLTADTGSRAVRTSCQWSGTSGTPPTICGFRSWNYRRTTGMYSLLCLQFCYLGSTMWWVCVLGFFSFCFLFINFFFQCLICFFFVFFVIPKPGILSL